MPARPGLGPRLVGVLALLSLGGGLGAYLVAGPRPPRAVDATASVTAALGGQGDAGFARALHPVRLVFPRDHGPHPAFRTEWWYYTGNLATADGRRFGFQLTFFRRGLTAAPVHRQSAWAAHEVYMAHFAVSDVAGDRFHAFERFSRAALDLGGATAEPFRVWVGDWSADGPADSPSLRAAAGGVAIDLRLRSRKPVVLQGDRGWSRKGNKPGSASYYYSLTRMATTGVVTIGGERHAVSGLAWMDREWGTSALEADQVGWDWFALQLSDGRELMFYRLRRRDGTAHPMSRGSLVAEDGSTRDLALGAVQIDPLATWRSPVGAIRYPSRWRVRVPAEGLDLMVSPRLPDQELALTFRYWEGAVAITGTSSGRAIDGTGYVELTGYGDSEGGFAPLPDRAPRR